MTTTGKTPKRATGRKNARGDATIARSQVGSRQAVDRRPKGHSPLSDIERRRELHLLERLLSEAGFPAADRTSAAMEMSDKLGWYRFRQSAAVESPSAREEALSLRRLIAACSAVEAALNSLAETTCYRIRDPEPRAFAVRCRALREMSEAVLVNMPARVGGRPQDLDLAAAIRGLIDVWAMFAPTVKPFGRSGSRRGRGQAEYEGVAITTVEKILRLEGLSPPHPDALGSMMARHWPVAVKHAATIRASASLNDGADEQESLTEILRRP